MSGVKLLEDGVVGAKTLSAVSSCDEHELLVACRSEAAGFYRTLVAGHPHLGVFLNGPNAWLARAYA